MKLDRRVLMNMAAAEKIWGPLNGLTLEILEELSRTYSLSVARGHLQILDGRWYITHAGLLDIARRKRCDGIQVRQVNKLCDPIVGRWVFKATVYKSVGSRGFVGYGDAEPTNVSSLVRGAEMRVAETRAVNRALRKAYGIGLCSVEELGWASERSETEVPKEKGPTDAGSNGHSNGQPRLRDRLCLLIREHRLDAALVKAYAADYCGTRTLHDASRESIEAFINDLAERAAKDRDGLVCHLNSYAKPQEVNP